MQPVIPLIITIISGGGIRRVGTECIDTDLSIIVITKYFSYEPKFNGVFPKNTLSRIKYGVYVINLNDNGTNGTHYVSLFIERNPAVYFDSFGIEYIPQEILNKGKDKLITHNIFRIKDNDSIMCRFYCIAFKE